jgi:hypothetical protein
MSVPYNRQVFLGRLATHHLGSTAAGQLADAIDEHGPSDPADLPAWAAIVEDLVAVTDVHQRTDAARRLSRSIADGEIPHAIELIARGIPLATVAYLAQVDWLRNVTAALDLGYPIDVLDALHSTSALTVGDIVTLHHTGMPREVLDQVISADVLIGPFTAILDSGGTWDDIAIILASGTPDVSPALNQYAVGVAVALNQYAAALTTPGIDRIPTRVTRLAAILSSPGRGTDALDLLPLASALTGQAWEGTVLGLLRDAGDTYDARDVTAAHRIILTARALENDPDLPAASTAPRPWTGPPILAQYQPTAWDTPPRDTLAAAGVHPDTIDTVTDWLRGHEAGLQEAGVPESGPWGMNAWGAIAAALAAGTSVTDLRVAATIISRGRTLGTVNAALVLACGVTLETAEQWARCDGDVLATALLTAYGIAEATALDLGRTDSGWHAVELLAGGLPADDVPDLLPVFANRPAFAMWPQPLRAGEGLPVSASLLTAIANSGLPLTEVHLSPSPAGPHDVPAPDEVNLLSVRTTRLLAPDSPPGDGWPYGPVVLAYAAAAAGQSWAHTITAPTGSIDRRIDVAAQVLAARGITPPARSVNRPRTAPTLTLGR